MSSHSVESYKLLLKSLLPKGKAWTRSEDSLLTFILKALGGEFVRVEDRLFVLLDEGLATRTSECLEDWEEEFGLPESGRELESTEEGRRGVVHAKQTAVGKQNPQYFKDICEALGYSIEILECSPFWAGSSAAGMTCGPSQNIFYWIVYVYIKGEIGAFSHDFDISLDTIWPFDRHYIDTLVRKLDTVIYEVSRLKPAHTIVLFDFYDAPFSRAFDWGFRAFPANDGTIVPGPFDGCFGTDFWVNWDYDGEYLVGPFAQAFNLSYDAYFGGDYERTGFDSSFSRMA